MVNLSQQATGSEPSAALLKVAIATLVLGAIATAIALGESLPDARVNYLGPLLMFSVGLTGAWLVGRGQLHLATRVLVYGVCLVVTGIAAFTGGVRSPVVVVYPVVILIFGWLTTARAAFTMALLIVALTLGLWAADQLGGLPAFALPAPGIYTLHQIIIYLLSAVLVIFILRTYQRQLQELNRMSDDLSQYTGLLEQNTDLLERAQAVARVGSWVADLTADRISPSAQGCMVLGLPEGRSLSSAQYLAMVHPLDRAAFLAGWKQALKSGLLDDEHRLVIGETTRWVRQRAELEIGSDGRVINVLGIAQDITERKLIAQALKESEARHRTLIEWTPEAILVHRQTRILYANPAAIKLFGAPDAATLLEKTTDSLIHPGSLAAQTARMLRIQSGESVEPVAEAVFLTLDGRTITVEVQGTAIEFDGKPAIHVSIRDITERKRMEDEIRQLAFYDALTGLPNRRLLADRLGQAISAHRRSGAWGALMFLDLDNFKPLNDHHGHATGDLLLVQAAQRITQCVREMDTVARFGGDEFVVVLVDLGTDSIKATAHAQAVAEKIRTALAATYRLDLPNASDALRQVLHNCTVSIGVVVYAAKDASVQQLTLQADTAMYRAKAEGRNRICLLGPTGPEGKTP